MSMNTPTILIGEVTSVEDSNYHIIRFTVNGYIEDQIAYPFAVMDEPIVGDELMIIELDPIFKTAYYYIKKKNGEHIEMRYKDKHILINEEDISIKTENAEITLKDDGELEVKGDNINITAEGDVTMSGTSIPNGTPGPFCALPKCLFTGVDHTSNKSTS